MGWLKWALGVSLLFNVLVLGGYLYGRHLAHDGGDWIADALQLQPDQARRLTDLRRNARLRLLRSRRDMTPERTALIQALREAQPGSDQLEPALRQLANARLPSQLELARRLVAFRATLTPEQQQTFNRLMGRPGFLLRLLGFSQAATQGSAARQLLQSPRHLNQPFPQPEGDP